MQYFKDKCSDITNIAVWWSVLVDKKNSKFVQYRHEIAI